MEASRILKKNRDRIDRGEDRSRGTNLTVRLVVRVVDVFATERVRVLDTPANAATVQPRVLALTTRRLISSSRLSTLVHSSIVYLLQ